MTFEAARSPSEGAAPGANAERDSTSNATRLANRAFWDAFISSVRFDHPDQPPPRHGGNNYVRIELTGPVTGLVAYRTADRTAGFMLKFVGEEGREVLQRLLDDQAALEAEIGEALIFEVGVLPGEINRVVGAITLAWEPPAEAVENDHMQAEWLRATANKFVNALRPRLT
jgi:hypothetical protein